MTWDGINTQRIDFAPPTSRRTYDLTHDVLSYRRCPRQYGFQKDHGFIVAQPAQRYVGAVIHSVLDLLVRDYQGTGDDPTLALHLPSEDRVRLHFETVREKLARQNIRPLNKEEDPTLERLQAFNRLEGPTLYPRVSKANFRLESVLGAERVTARVDLVRRDVEDAAPVQLWIYKGSRPPVDTDEDYAARTADNELHVRIMAELFKRNNRGTYPDCIVVYFLGSLPDAPEGARLAFESFMPKDQETALAALEATVADLQQCMGTQQWDPPPDGARTAGEGTCVACPFRWSCPVAAYGPPSFPGVKG